MYCTYLLIDLEGGLKLQVVPVCQNVTEGGLVRSKTTLSCLTSTNKDQKTLHQGQNTHTSRKHRDTQSKSVLIKKKEFWLEIDPYTQLGFLHKLRIDVNGRFTRKKLVTHVPQALFVEILPSY